MATDPYTRSDLNSETSTFSLRQNKSFASKKLGISIFPQGRRQTSIQQAHKENLTSSVLMESVHTATLSSKVLESFFILVYVSLTKTSEVAISSTVEFVQKKPKRWKSFSE